MFRTAILASLSFALAAQERPVLVQNVRVFDGERVLAADSVRFEKGRITEVGRALALNGATAVDGTGQTLLPGLIDAHVHAFGNALGQSLSFGVTTVIDCFTDPTFVRDAKARASKTEADIFSSGNLATVPGGHGTEFGMKVPTLATVAEAGPWVKARLAEGSDFIKIVREDGKAYAMSFPNLELPVVGALIQEAHGAKRLAVAHVATEADARACLELGLDGLAHVWGDVAPSKRTLELLKGKGRFVVPTLSVFQASMAQPIGPVLAKDAALRPYLPLAMVQGVTQQADWQKAAVKYYPAGLEATRVMHKAGVTLLAGTDAPNPGTTYGLSLHGELALLVEAGLTPTQALKAATAAPAAAFRMDDRGRIRTGARADLLLVKGDPTQDITATRAITQVWKLGEALDRAPIAAAIEKARVAAAQASPVQAPARWSFAAPADFTTWTPSTDGMAGGASTVKLAAHPEGGLHITGTIDGKLPFAWAGAMWMPAGAFNKGLDFRSVKALRFRVTGTGSGRLMLYTTTGGFMPQEKRFEAKPEGVEVTIPFSAFKGDLGKVNALILCAGPKPGPVDLRIQELRVE